MDKFYKLVKEMREAQKLFDRQPSQTYGRRMRGLENLVDAQLTKHDKAQAQAEQMTLAAPGGQAAERGEG